MADDVGAGKGIVEPIDQAAAEIIAPVDASEIFEKHRYLPVGQGGDHGLGDAVGVVTFGLFLAQGPAMGELHMDRRLDAKAFDTVPGRYDGRGWRLLPGDAEDQAVFMKYAPKNKHALTYGVEILAYAHESRPPVVEGVEVYGSSPAGQGQGEDASPWLTKKEVKGAAGKTSGAVLRVVDAAARNQNLAGDLAKNIMGAYRVKAQGRLRVLGAPEVQLGDAVKLGKLPVAAHNGEARVTSMRHRLDARHGFITNLLWEKV